MIRKTLRMQICIKHNIFRSPRTCTAKISMERKLKNGSRLPRPRPAARTTLSRTHSVIGDQQHGPSHRTMGIAPDREQAALQAAKLRHATGWQERSARPSSLAASLPQRRAARRTSGMQRGPRPWRLLQPRRRAAQGTPEMQQRILSGSRGGHSDLQHEEFQRCSEALDHGGRCNHGDVQYEELPRCSKGLRRWRPQRPKRRAAWMHAWSGLADVVAMGACPG